MSFKMLRKNYFNPHSREGSDLSPWLMEVCNHISIHTPAKGVTPFSTNYGCGFLISIHTPAKGVTLIFVQFADS